MKELHAVKNEGSDKYVFSEYLGYESKPDAEMQDDISADLKRYDGKISSIVRKFSSQTGNRVRWNQYAYSYSGEMVAEDIYSPTSSNHLSSDGALQPGQLDFDTPDKQFEYGYDRDKTIDYIQKGDVMHEYTYKPGTHKLDKIVPDISADRETKNAGTFSYDDNGRMDSDNSLGKSVSYNYYNMPVATTVGGAIISHFYDENHYQAATIWEENGSVTKKIYVYENGLTIAKEYMVDDQGQVTKKINHFGIEGVIGVEGDSDTDKKLVVKNYLGSVVKELNVNTLTGTDEQGYNAFGEMNRLVMTTGIKTSEKFTGKEWSDELNSYYFGARWYDPELAMWLTPDPGYQYHNPYSYVGGDPVNMHDKNGLWGAHIHIVGSFLGALAAGEGISNSAQIAYHATMQDFVAGSQANTAKASTIHAMRADAENISKSDALARADTRVKSVLSNKSMGRNQRIGYASHTASDKTAHHGSSMEDHLTFNPLKIKSFLKSMYRIVNDNLNPWGLVDTFLETQDVINQESQLSTTVQNVMPSHNMSIVSPAIVLSLGLSNSTTTSTSSYSPNGNVSGMVSVNGQMAGNASSSSLNQSTPSSSGGYKGPTPFPWSSPFAND
ncbi:MAG: RHS repeat-associated core domain-containing protein [Fibrobacteria bacterium]|nr:RHS repeat-associated core domain-containing protein [Fibrobacteria bacterium]